MHTHTCLMGLCPGLPRYQKKHLLTYSRTGCDGMISSDILHQLLPSTTIHSILLVQFTCLTVLFHTPCLGPLWYPLGLGPSTSYFIHFFNQSSSSFRNTCPCHRSLFCCKYAHPSDHSHLCSLKCHHIFFPYMPGLTSMLHAALHATTVQPSSHNLSRSSLISSYISSSSHRVLFAIHARTIAACSAVIPMLLCHH